jgi:hypothetical protein
MIRAITSASPGRLQRNPVVRGQALREQPERRRRRLDPPSAPHPTSLRDRHLAEVTVHIQANEPHPHLLPVAQRHRRGGRNDNYGSVRTTHPGSRRGRPTPNRGPAAHSDSSGLPNLASPRSPCPGTTHDANPGTGHNDSTPRSSCPYNRGRPHRALDLKPPDSSARSTVRAESTSQAPLVSCRDLLGGLIHEYYRAAA